MTGAKKNPAPAATGCEAQDKSFNDHSSRTPLFPANGNYANHCRAVLGCLLTGRKVDQFSYHSETGLPLVDYRTRISNLRLECYWPIDDEFHDTFDFNGEPRRVKRYWLNQDAMSLLFKLYPGFKDRCTMFTEQDKQGGRKNG